MKNYFIDKLNKKDLNHFTSDLGLFIRKRVNKPFIQMCNVFTDANIIKTENDVSLSDEEYFNQLDINRVSLAEYDIKQNKNNIVLERYPALEKDESYIFVCNHTCPEDIETVLNILDRNTYLILGSIESLKYNPEMYLTWLNGMIVFDIMDGGERKELMPKMERVIETNSLLIFPEGSHNNHPNKIINNLFAGAVNLSLKKGNKIVVVSLVKDKENNISYIDVSNPIDVNNIDVNKDNNLISEKDYVKSITALLRDKMATAVYYILLRHLDVVKRRSKKDIEEHFRQQYVEDAFKHLKWNNDVFEAEYLVKKTKEEKEYEEVITTLSNLVYNEKRINKNLNSREYVLKMIDLEQKNVANNMRTHWLNNIANNNKETKLVRTK